MPLVYVLVSPDGQAVPCLAAPAMSVKWSEERKGATQEQDRLLFVNENRRMSR